ncbi:MAG: hypothetical protein KGD63_04190 [Candidatus Lokiarchaeota archaeon]|nr:hypothetical protein [Candidatus Lokiarchaeota archaeon]
MELFIKTFNIVIYLIIMKYDVKNQNIEDFFNRVKEDQKKIFKNKEVLELLDNITDLFKEEQNKKNNLN